MIPTRERSDQPAVNARASKAVAVEARVLIVDDQALFRSGLARLLAEDPLVEVVGEAVDGVEAVEQAARTNPDVVLMDLKMPRLDGVQATQEILAANPQVKVLILTTFEATSDVLRALRAGASGYVLKDARPDAIVSSILAVKAGTRVLAGPVTERVLEMIGGDSASRGSLNGLTTREVEILKLMSAGLANSQIAVNLKISGKTVRNHVSNMYAKLQVYDRSQAILYALRKGIVEL
jgi:DNA-binding NarL/FixJ family response regulator